MVHFIENLTIYFNNVVFLQHKKPYLYIFLPNFYYKTLTLCLKYLSINALKK